MKRICSLCGAMYEPNDTIQRCIEYQGGSYCGGEVLPPPEEHKPAAKCLVCMDTRKVEILGKEQDCPRLVIPGVHREKLDPAGAPTLESVQGQKWPTESKGA